MGVARSGRVATRSMSSGEGAEMGPEAREEVLAALFCAFFSFLVKAARGRLAAASGLDVGASEVRLASSSSVEGGVSGRAPEVDLCGVGSAPAAASVMALIRPAISRNLFALCSFVVRQASQCCPWPGG